MSVKQPAGLSPESDMEYADHHLLKTPRISVVSQGRQSRISCTQCGTIHQGHCEIPKVRFTRAAGLDSDDIRQTLCNHLPVVLLANIPLFRVF